MTTIVSEIDAFVTAQNKGRGEALAGGGTVPSDFDALTGTGSSGQNAVSGISGIAAGAQALTLASGQAGNAVIVDGAIASTASASGADSYSLFVDKTGAVTVTDNNTGNSESVSGANYLIFNGGTTNVDGSYSGLKIIATGTTAEVAEMYNAALGRQPDLPGLEFYAIPTAGGALSLHQDAVFFEASPEFKALYPALQTVSDNGGPNDQAFITQLYGQILHRTPTAAEINFYVQYMEGTLSGSTGPGNRADLLVYFSVSPENQKDVAGWLINPANGAVNLGALTVTSAPAVLTTEIAAGTVNASDFDTMPVSITDQGGDTDKTSVNNVGIAGPNATLASGLPVQGSTINAGPTAPANLTIDLDSVYFSAGMGSQNETVNGVSGGGSLIHTPSSSVTASQVNLGGTVNLSANGNFILFGNSFNGNIAVPTVLHGWNSTDVLAKDLSGPMGNVRYTYGFATNGELGGQFGVVVTGSAASPATLAAYENRQGIIPTAAPYAVNIGTVSDDSTASMVTAVNQAFHVLDVQGEQAFFYGEDPQGNTMVFYWRGDKGGAHSVVAADLTGAVELVGVHAASLTGANFHN